MEKPLSTKVIKVTTEPGTYEQKEYFGKKRISYTGVQHYDKKKVFSHKLQEVVTYLVENHFIQVIQFHQGQVSITLIKHVRRHKKGEGYKVES